MRQMFVACGAALMMASGAAMAQAPAPPAGQVGAVAEVQRSYAGVKENILKSADKMPAANYSYKPVADIRTYARVLNHISEAQFRSCGAVNGKAEASLPKVPAETADKAAIVAALKASFKECDTAFTSLTSGNLQDLFPFGQGRRSRVGLVWGTVSHDNEQYATLALYLLLKGIAPPSSEK
ncbi:DinB family protein [Edaphobacter aggregans]|uniref:DinB family protein n=1 Tax=Edaphobacter aggregans TaxID=570835 RepID=UPI00054FA10D|nr:DinB family protein [Edaphobacter aggregans]